MSVNKDAGVESFTTESDPEVIRELRKELENEKSRIKELERCISEKDSYIAKLRAYLNINVPYWRAKIMK